MSGGGSLLSVLRQLGTRNAILLYVTVRERPQWWATTAQYAELAGVSQRRAEQELTRLVSEGFLLREERGAQNHTRLVRFRVSPEAPRRDRNDRSAPIETIGAKPPRSDRNDRSAGASLLTNGSICSLDPRSNRPSILEGVGGEGTETDGRTGRESSEGRQERIVTEPLCRSVSRLWPEVPASAVRPALVRLVACGATSGKEIVEYLTSARRYVDTHRGSDAFAGLEHATHPFGAACTERRFQTWCELKARALRAAAEVREAERKEEKQERSAPTPEAIRFLSRGRRR